MRLLDLTLPSAAENLALDEILLLEAEAGRGGEVLRLWENPSLAVVLGAGGILRDDVNVEACAADGVPILRRSSGGGTVLIGPGCLCYTLILSFDRSAELGGIRSSYAYILSAIADTLSDLLPAVEPAGISDLASHGRKFSGNAQQRKRCHLLHHGTLLYAFPLPLLSRYLREPPRRPEYRSARTHIDFVRNLPATRDELRDRLCATYQAEERQTTWPAERVRQLVEEKYARREWIERR